MLQDNEAALRSLCQHDIEFIVVGGLAAVLNGAPVNTFDVDILFSRSPENIPRILRWAEEADAFFRIQPERRFRLNESYLNAGRHLNLLTRYGRIDLLGFIGEDLGFSQLLPQTAEMKIGGGARVRVLNLETIIAVKEALGGEKDLATLPILRSTLKVLRGMA
jgi:predicted nucleotidyltransferase